MGGFNLDDDDFMDNDEYIDHVAMVVEATVGEYLDQADEAGVKLYSLEENDPLLINAGLIVDLTLKAREFSLEVADDHPEFATAILTQFVCEAVKILDNRANDITPEDVFNDDSPDDA